MQQINIDNIPEELKALDNWVLWKLQDVKGRKTKVPYQVNGKAASSTNKNTWFDFNTVLNKYNNSNQYSGIGFMFSNTSISGIDIDHCITNGVISEYAQKIINNVNSYTEKSQSGTGIHILVKGSIPKAIKKEEIEIYSKGRYFTVTGNRIYGSDIEERQDILNSFYDKYKPNKVTDQAVKHTRKSKHFNNSISELLNRAFTSKNGFRIEALYNGNWQSLYNSQSEADQALCNYLAFWLDRDFNDVDNAFSNSGLYRDKWDRNDYKNWTINKAINDCKETYQEYCQRNTSNKYLEAESQPDYIYVNDGGKTCVNTGLLANYIRNNCSYMIVRKQGYDNDFLYWYKNGCYRRVSANEFKGEIKLFIPEEIRKSSLWEEVYKNLMTDKTSIKFEDLNTGECSKFINFKNGLYNIKTRILEEHNPQVCSTMQLNCSYKEDAKYPDEWMDFIETLANNDADIMNILQEWFGLTISNIPGFITKKCLALWGIRGNTGKTQYLKMLTYLLDSDNICSTSIQDLSKPFGVGDIYGAKAILIDDQTSANIEDSSIFKSITGGGYVRCEIKGKQAFSYEFIGTLIFACNDLPYFKGDKGDHVFERMIIIPCDNVIPVDKRIGNIIDKFKSEADGIILWAIQGLHRLIGNGYKFTTGVVCDTALEEYRKLNDTLYNFIQENYIITNDKKDKVGKVDFEDKYFQWCEKNEKQALEKKNIPVRAKKHGVEFLKTDGYWFYRGIQLSNDGVKELYPVTEVPYNHQEEFPFTN